MSKTENWLLHPTDTAQWQALVREAGERATVSLREELESYLVFMLMRFVGEPTLANSVLALDFLEGNELTGRMRVERLRDVGDKCLLFSGLFPGRAQRRRVTISYFVGIGRSAYSEISTDDMKYQMLCDEFVPMVDVLQATRHLEEGPPGLNLLHADELWRELNCDYARSVLEERTEGLLIRSGSTRH